ncbi:MAG TPA: ISAs1 family transposase [Leptolyngbyaceae cyanobacterium]
MQWASSTFPTSPNEWVSIDGKSIRGTVTGSRTAYQNFVSLVSVYSSRLSVVLATQQFESKNSGELTFVQTLLKALQLEGVVFTMDALHCQKNYATNY